jgi:hypothetical protein
MIAYYVQFTIGFTNGLQHYPQLKHRSFQSKQRTGRFIPLESNLHAIRIYYKQYLRKPST